MSSKTKGTIQPSFSLRVKFQLVKQSKEYIQVQVYAFGKVCLFQSYGAKMPEWASVRVSSDVSLDIHIRILLELLFPEYLTDSEIGIITAQLINVAWISC